MEEEGELSFQERPISRGAYIVVVAICIGFITSGTGLAAARAAASNAAPLVSRNQFELLISNNQTSATQNPYQQMLIFNSALFQEIENPRLSNVEFMYPNGTAIPSWIESGATSTSHMTIYWLRLNGIAAKSSQPIYMHFANKSSNLFSATGPVGEAPQLSPVYAEYDNGAHVFSWYQNFNGTALPTSLIYAYNNSYSASEYVTVEDGMHIRTSYIPSVGFGVHVNIRFGPNTTTEIFGLPMYPDSNEYSAGFFGYDVGNGQNNLTIGNPSGSESVTFPYQYGRNQMGHATGVWSVMRSGTEAWGMFNYSASSPFTHEPTGYYTIGDHGQGNALPSFIQWWRVRATPPNGIMPLAYFNMDNLWTQLPTVNNSTQRIIGGGNSPGAPSSNPINQPLGQPTTAIAFSVIGAAVISTAILIGGSRKKKRL